ncbi:hypothetical protein CEY12_06125 [Chryseobacterium sp. T16E-39]|uniref:hypothetical protein n=1 Tax=Chryseobacterium sp. T16E-39 TaxID=2015076 RepID=UPI000B5B321E|nr:hypothetical protein [Chryseobacterium sp. T16E-39]ASK29705.1 hypothetical protein CEY12_06125 [Chryseobacterium sp. T16E-39]
MKTKEEQLKIYSAYLPYGLNFQITIGWDNSVIKLDSINCYPSERLILNNNPYYEAKKVKPILYPLDMLTQEIEHEGEKFIPLRKVLEEYHFDLTKMDEKYILSFKEALFEVDMSYKTAQMLLSWHFNIFQLPEDLYINKATLNQKSC